MIEMMGSRVQGACEAPERNGRRDCELRTRRVPRCARPLAGERGNTSHVGAGSARGTSSASRQEHRGVEVGRQKEAGSWNVP